jgi:hypothetical protein
MADQGAPSPVHAYVRKEPMLDLIPFARAGRQVANADSHIAFVGKRLELKLPQSDAIPVTSGAVRTN